MSEPLRPSAIFAIVAIALGTSLNPVNGSLVVTAYPELARTFDVPYAHISALVMYFMAATAVAQPLAGGLGDFLGRKNIFLLGVSGFTVASVFAGYAQDFNALLTWRMTQAVFSGVIMANGISLLSQVVSPEKIATYIGLLTSAMVGSSALAFPMGGVLLESFEWPILFWINVPIGLVAFFLAVFFIPKDKPANANFTSLSFIGLPFLPLAFGLQAYVQRESVWMFMLATVVLAALVLKGVMGSDRSRRQIKQLNSNNFNLGCAVAFFASTVTFALMFIIPAWIAVTLHIERAALGLYLSAFTGSMLIVNPTFGRLIDRRGARGSQILSFVTVFIGVVIMLTALTKISFALSMMSIGAGIAIAQLVAQRASLLSAPVESQALAMGIFNSYRSIGSILGNALAAVILAGSLAVSPEDGIEVLQWVLGIFVVPLAISLWFLREPESSSVLKSTV